MICRQYLLDAGDVIGEAGFGQPHIFSTDMCRSRSQTAVQSDGIRIW